MSRRQPRPEEFVHLLLQSREVVAACDAEPDLGLALATEEEKKDLDKKAKHVFMYDPFGPNKDEKLSSGLVAPYWLPIHGCMTMTADQWTGNQATLARISQAYTVALTGANAANASALAKDSLSK